MIGKPEWFTYRILGWGVRPKTKEGWLYILAFLIAALAIWFIPMDAIYKSIAISIVIIVIVLDVVHIMTQLGKHHDERERLQQLIIERNCSFAAVAALVIIAIFQAIINKGETMPIDLSIFIVIGAMVLAKIASWIYVSKSM